MEKYPNLKVLHQSNAVISLFTKIRDVNTSCVDFKRYSDRLMTLLAEEGLCEIESQSVEIQTPTGTSYQGLSPSLNICVVSIIRAGDSLLNAVLRCEPSLAFVKILIQRDETTEEKRPMMYYSKLPPGIANMHVLLADPMLATGGSAKMAIETLLKAGVPQNNIWFLNVVACPEGIESLFLAYPDIHVITSAMDKSLNEDKYIIPGLGDYGDRYFNTI